MTRRDRRARGGERASLGLAKAQAGELETAARLFQRAVDADPADFGSRLNLALAQMRTGQPDAAAINFTKALRANPQLEPAARHLAMLLQRHRPADPGALDAYGLKAAMAFADIDREALARTVFLRHAGDGPIAAAIEHGWRESWPEAARALIARRRALQDDLLVLALRIGVNISPDLERLLTALRRVMLLEAEPERFQDRGLLTFAVALAAQCHNTDHVLATEPDEAAAVSGMAVDSAALLAGDASEARRLLLACLYRPLEALLPEVSAESCDGIRPREVRDWVMRRLAEVQTERDLARNLETLTPIEDAVSRRVADQY